MAIPETQLDTWAHQGSTVQSASTYQIIRNALLDPNSGYADKSFDVFLQGSYGNDTNIYSESDVDVVIRLDSIYNYDVSGLNPGEKQEYLNSVTPATYSFDEFKRAVLAQLVKKFGVNAVTAGNKAIKVAGNGSRRDADVVVCYRHRKINSGSALYRDNDTLGIIFPTPTGNIINYPKQHSDNLTSQHQATGGMLKHMVRILKNMRSHLVAKGELKAGVAPSYYIEGLFFNVPAEQYVSNSFGDTFCNGITWLVNCDKSKLVCANWQYYLLGTSNVQWNASDCNAFLAAICILWKEYR